MGGGGLWWDAFPFFPSRLFSWPVNSVDERQINRRHTNLTLYLWEPQRYEIRGQA